MKRNDPSFRRLVRWGMHNKVEAVGYSFRCEICLWEPAPEAYYWAMNDHIKKHVEDGEITETMMLEAWKKQSEGQ